jgi:hypothetical protein
VEPNELKAKVDGEGELVPLNKSDFEPTPHKRGILTTVGPCGAVTHTIALLEAAADLSKVQSLRTGFGAVKVEAL